MSKLSTLTTDYNKSASNRLNAMRDYLEIVEQRRNTPKGYEATVAEHGLVKLGHYMPGLAGNTDLTLQDKKYFYMLYIKLLKDVGDMGAALNCSQAALDLDPKDPKTVSQHAALLKHELRFDEAAKLLKEAVEENPRDKFLITALADTHRANGDYQIAEDCYRRVQFLDPHDRIANDRLRELHQKPF